jgi:hypothetical protein
MGGGGGEERRGWERGCLHYAVATLLMPAGRCPLPRPLRLTTPCSQAGSSSRCIHQHHLSSSIRYRKNHRQTPFIRFIKRRQAPAGRCAACSCQVCLCIQPAIQCS